MTEGSNNFKPNDVNWRQVLCALDMNVMSAEEDIFNPTIPPVAGNGLEMASYLEESWQK